MEGSSELRYSIVAVTVSAFSTQTTVDQARWHAHLTEILDEAWHAVQVGPSPWLHQDMGDGVLILVPANIPESRLIGDFIRELVAALNRHNRYMTSKGRLRLQVSMHSGRVDLEQGGLVGGPITVAYRLLEAPQLRAALDDQPTADLVMVISDEVYRDVVGQGYRDLDDNQFQRIEFTTKTGEKAGWLYTPQAATIVEGSIVFTGPVITTGDIVHRDFDGQEFDPPPPPSRK
jgi:hypothetical protein